MLRHGLLYLSYAIYLIFHLRSLVKPYQLKRAVVFFFVLTSTNLNPRLSVLRNHRWLFIYCFHLYCVRLCTFSPQVAWYIALARALVIVLLSLHLYILTLVCLGSLMSEARSVMGHFVDLAPAIMG